jgi:hypothetical protein
VSLQIGGKHYEAEYQHWDWAIDVRLGNLETPATKYIFRWYKKNGIEDLRKARSYLLKIKEVYFNNRYNNQCLHVDTWPQARDKAEVMFSYFVDEAEVPTVEADLCLKIAQWETDIDLNIIIRQIERHINAATRAAVRQQGVTPLAPLMTPLPPKISPTAAKLTKLPNGKQAKLKRCSCGGKAELMFDELNLSSTRGTVMCMICYNCSDDHEKWQDAIIEWNNG